MKRIRIALVQPIASSGQTYQLDGYCSQAQKGLFRWHPLDFIALGSAWNAQGALVTVFDTPHADADKLLASTRAYDLVLSLCGAHGWHDHLPFLEALAARHPRVFLSGDLARHEPDFVFQNLPRIAGIIPELAVAPQLTDMLELRTTTGLWMPGDRSRAIPKPENQFTLGTQNFHGWNHSRYSVPFTPRWPVASVLTQVGCPYTCDYCMLSEYDTATRNYDELAQELRQLRGQGAKQLYVRDATLNSSRRHFETVLAILGRTGIAWNAFARIEGIGKWARELAHAGASALQFGLDSPNIASLKQHRKTTHHAQIVETLAALRAAGIQTTGHFVLGLEDDGGALAISTYARSLGLDWFTVTPLTIRPGTRQWRDKHGLARLRARELDASWLAGWQAQVAHGLFYARKPVRTLSILRNQVSIVRRTSGWRSWSHGY